ncbi:hypothetical protein NHX12_020724, partial [Muraenolepis orangiensis]
MNELNVKLQGKDQFAHDMYTNVRAFKSKLVLFSRQMSNKSFAHFPTLAVQKEAARNAKKYCKSLDDLHREFCRRFCDFEKIDKSLQLVSCPLSQDPESAPQELQLELIDLQSDSVSKEKFKSLKLNDFYASLNETAFPNLRRTAQKMLVLFGSTYVWLKTTRRMYWWVVYWWVVYWWVVYCWVVYCWVVYCWVVYCWVVHWWVVYCWVVYCWVVYCWVVYCWVVYCLVVYWWVVYCWVVYWWVVYCWVVYGWVVY